MLYSESNADVMNEIFTVRLADTNIKIEARTGLLREFFKDYVTEGKAEYCISISDADLDFEKHLLQETANYEESVSYQYEDRLLGTLAVHRKIADCLVDRNTVLLHGSAVMVDGEGYVFTAPSGTGKSTHARLWRDLLGERAVMINDDKPFVHIANGGAMVYGAPWDGKHRLSTNTKATLKSICILERAEKNTIEEISEAQAFDVFVRQIYRPKSPDKLIRTLKLVDELGKSVKLYRLGCNMNSDAAEISFSVMSGREKV